MATHDLKIWPEHFDEIVSGIKKYEVRLNDRGFEVGDTLNLREWEPGSKAYTMRGCEVRVIHITYGSSAPPDLLFPHACVMGILPIKWWPK